MTSTFLFNLKKRKKLFYFIILLIFSISFNQYFGNIGVFPEDTFLTFNSGYDTLNGYYPFKDYYTTTGPLLDLLQAIFFKILGVTWFSYVFHASIINFLITIATFHTLNKFNLNINFCFFYSFLVAILAYPTSGTPFMDHHSTYLSIISIFTFILAIKTKSNFYWFILPLIVGFAFLSKQVPAGYIFLIISFLSIIYFCFNFEIKKILLSLLGALTFIILFILILSIGKISLTSFFQQYILFPQTLGASRLEILFPLDFTRLFLRFKLQHLSLLLVVVLIVRQTSNNLKYLKSDEFLIILSLIFTSFALIVLELMTINEKFVFFIIPIFTGFSHIFYEKYFKRHKFILYFFILLSLPSTIWYYYNYIDNRKFLSLDKVSIKNNIDAKILDEKLMNLKWINVLYPTDPKKEVVNLKKAIKIIENDKRNKAIVTDYQFVSVFLDVYDNSPNRVWHEGANYPFENNKYYNLYKKFFISKLKENQVEIIYTLSPLWGVDNSDNILKPLSDKKCVKKTVITNILNSYFIKDCAELK